MARSRLSDWFEHRTGLVKAVRGFMLENIPASSGWRNTLGGLAGALVLVQMVTGFLLALYYVPHPEAAFASLTWMADNVSLGALVRALHYWGASFIVVALFLHLSRVFFAGAYKSPRETTWLTGLALFALMLTLAFTGLLLPYSQMGYWTARVGIEIASSAPVIGPAIRSLLMGGATIGALTLTRFYALHVIVLPPAMGLLIVLHLYLLRRHGPARPAHDTGTAMQPFFPYQFARDMIVISLGLVALGAVAILVGGPEGAPLDLTDMDYQPRPEWYFVAHYEILKWTEGGVQKVLATFVLPLVLLIACVLLPWLDRRESKAIGQRRVVVGTGTVVLASIVGLTLFGIATAPGGPAAEEPVSGEAREAADPALRTLADGRRIFRDLDCMTCHRVNGRGKTKGPDLSGVGLRLQEKYLRSWLRDPGAFRTDSIMPPVTVDEAKFDALVLYLMSLDREPDRVN